MKSIQCLQKEILMHINMCLGCKHHCYFIKFCEFSEVTTYLHTKFMLNRNIKYARESLKEE